MCATPERTLVANATLARRTVDTQLFLMAGALVFLTLFTLQDVAESYIQTELLKILHLRGDVLQPTTVDNFAHVKCGPTMRTLPLLIEPARYTNMTAKFRTVRTQMSVLQLLHTNEAPEEIINGRLVGKILGQQFNLL